MSNKLVKLEFSAVVWNAWILRSEYKGASDDLKCSAILVAQISNPLQFECFARLPVKRLASKMWFRLRHA